MQILSTTSTCLLLFLGLVSLSDAQFPDSVPQNCWLSGTTVKYNKLSQQGDRCDVVMLASDKTYVRIFPLPSSQCVLDGALQDSSPAKSLQLRTLSNTTTQNFITQSNFNSHPCMTSALNRTNAFNTAVLSTTVTNMVCPQTATPSREYDIYQDAYPLTADFEWLDPVITIPQVPASYRTRCLATGFVDYTDPVASTTHSCPVSIIFGQTHAVLIPSPKCDEENNRLIQGGAMAFTFQSVGKTASGLDLLTLNTTSVPPGASMKYCMIGNIAGDDIFQLAWTKTYVDATSCSTEMKNWQANEFPDAGWLRLTVSRSGDSRSIPRSPAAPLTASVTVAMLVAAVSVMLCM